MPGQPFYGTVQWKAARLACLRRHQWCCAWCGASLRALGASRVDHIKPVRTHPALALAQDNLRALCAPCDNRRHAEKGRAQRRSDADGLPLDPAHHWNARKV